MQDKGHARLIQGETLDQIRNTVWDAMQRASGIERRKLAHAYTRLFGLATHIVVMTK